MTYVVGVGGGVIAARNAYPFPTSAPRETAPNRGRIALLDQLGRTMTYEAMFRTQPWVYAVVTKQVYALGRTPLKTYVMGDDDERQRAERGNPLDMLLRRPWGRGSSAWKFKVHIIWDLLIHGQALLVMGGKAGAPPTELWPVPWRNVITIEDESGILGFKVRLPSGDYFVDPGRVVHFELPGRVSPLEPLRRTLAVEHAALTWQGENFRNGITPRGAFTTDQTLNERTLPRLRAELETLYAGPENAGRFGMFDQSLKWTQMGTSAIDAALIDQRKLNREEVCGVYDVPPTSVGILDRAIMGNVRELRKQVYVDAVGPKASLIEITINADIVWEVPAWDGYFVEFDLNTILRPDPEARARAHLMEQQASTSTINERRRRENLPAIDDPVADTVLIPVNMTPVGVESPTPAPAPGAPPAPALNDTLTAEAVRAGTAADTDPGDPLRTVEDDDEQEAAP